MPEDYGSADVVSNQSSPTNAGAPPALRGFRLQHLYTLHQLLCQPQRTGYTIVLEGTEDLEVFAPDGTLIEAVQVKAYTGNVTPSTLTSKRESFFTRANTRLLKHPASRQRVVSFGPFGMEFLNALEGVESARSNVTAYIQRQGVPIDRVDVLLASLDLTQETEANLERDVMATLAQCLTGTDPQVAFSYLSGWLYRAMETRERVDAQEVQRRISAVGQFIHERTVHRHWFTTIQPLEPRSLTELRQSRLTDEFLRGSYTTFEHVLADLDVPRPEKQQAVADAASRATVTVVHGASGQGKTVLAYRYLHDLPPDVWRYEIKSLRDAEQALEVAATIVGHAEAIGVRFVVYFDVPPRHVEWTLLARELARLDNVGVLVTVREEDWRYAQQEGFQLEFADVALDFDESEAQALFDRLVSKYPREHLLDFQHAWESFGERGPLMEFAYLVTQAVALPNKLDQQVKRIRRDVQMGRRRPEELEVLRRVAVASAFGARLDLAVLQDELRLPDLVHTLDLLEEEYLLRRTDDDRFVQGLHPVRSALLSEFLTGREVEHTWIATAAASLPAVAEDDLEVFLKAAFEARPDDRDELAQHLPRLTPRSWLGTVGVTRALLWLGVRAFFEVNKDVIKEAHARFGAGWWMFLNLDPAGVHRVAPTLHVDWNDASWLTDNMRDAVARLSSRRDDRVDPYAPARSWLHTLCLPDPPHGPTEWAAAAELVFWHRLMQDWPAPQLLFHTLPDVVHELPLDLAADVFFAQAYTPSPNLLSPQLVAVQEQLLARLRAEAGLLRVEDDSHTILVHYAYPASALFGGSAVQATPNIARDEHPHAESKWRIELLRRIVPDREKYGARGHGHMLPFFPWPYDPADMPSVNVDMLLPPWLPELNNTFHRLADQELQLATVREHAETVLQYRRTVMLAVQRLHDQLWRYFKRRRSSTVSWKWDTNSLASWDDLPVLSQRLDVLPEALREVARPMARPNDRHEPYRRALRNFTTSMGNFRNQFLTALVWAPVLRTPQASSRRNAARHLVQANGGDSDAGRLPLINLSDVVKRLKAFQQEYRRRFAWADPELATLEKQEATALYDLLLLWALFVYHAGRTFADPSSEASRRFHVPLANARMVLETTLPTLERYSARVNILANPPDWDGAPALWVTVDLDEPMLSTLVLPELQERLNAAFPAMHSYGLNYVALEHTCPHVVVLPLYGGRIVDSVVWVATTARLINEVDTPLAFWVSELPPDIVQTLQFGVEQQTDLFYAHAFQATYVTLQAVLGYVRIVTEAAADTSDEAMAHSTLGNIVARAQELIQQLLTTLGATAEVIARRVLAHQDELDERDALRLIADDLPHILTALAPPGTADVATDTYTGTMLDVAMWEEQLQSQAWLVDEVKLAWLSDLRSHPNEPAE